MGKKKKLSKFQRTINWLKEWKEVIAIIIGFASLIYAVTLYKVNLENEVKNKITVEEARTLIQIENSELKQDIRDIKNYLMKNDK